MQGLADGYFVLPYTIGDYLSNDIKTGKVNTNTQPFEDAERAVKEFILNISKNKSGNSVDHYHKKLGKIMWDKCGMSRNEKDLKQAINDIRELRKDFYGNVVIPGETNSYNEELAKAGRVADFLELGELFAIDALERKESCGGHFREEYQTEEGEALRNDAEYAFVSCWEFMGIDKRPKLNKEELHFESIELKSRSYK